MISITGSERFEPSASRFICELWRESSKDSRRLRPSLKPSLSSTGGTLSASDVHRMDILVSWSVSSVFFVSFGNVERDRLKYGCLECFSSKFPFMFREKSTCVGFHIVVYCQERKKIKVY